MHEFDVKAATKEECRCIAMSLGFVTALEGLSENKAKRILKVADAEGRLASIQVFFQGKKRPLIDDGGKDPETGLARANTVLIEFTLSTTGIEQEAVEPFELLEDINPLTAWLEEAEHPDLDMYRVIRESIGLFIGNGYSVKKSGPYQSTPLLVFSKPTGVVPSIGLMEFIDDGSDTIPFHHLSL